MTINGKDWRFINDKDPTIRSHLDSIIENGKVFIKHYLVFCLFVCLFVCWLDFSVTNFIDSLFPVCNAPVNVNPRPTQPALDRGIGTWTLWSEENALTPGDTLLFQLHLSPRLQGEIRFYFMAFIKMKGVTTEHLKTCSKCPGSWTERSESWFISRMPGTQKRVKQGKCPRIAPVMPGLGRVGVYID